MNVLDFDVTSLAHVDRNVAYDTRGKEPSLLENSDYHSRLWVRHSSLIGHRKRTNNANFDEIKSEFKPAK